MRFILLDTIVLTSRKDGKDIDYYLVCVYDRNKNIYENDILKIVEFDLKVLTKEEIFELMYASEDDKKNVISKEVEQVKIDMQKYLKKALDFYNN